MTAAPVDVAQGGDLAAPRPPASVPLDHWAYPLLERLAARDLLEIDLSTRPVSRADIADALAGLDVRAFGDRGSERERWVLDRLRSEFELGAVDVPAVSMKRGEASLGLGLSVGVQGVYGGEREVSDLWPGELPDGTLRIAAGAASAEPRVTVSDEDELDPAVVVAYELWGGVGDRFGFEAESRVILREQDGPRQVRLSSRARTWRGVAALAERAYVLWESEHLSVAAGRRGPAWGRARWGRLLISGRAPTFDQVDARYSVGSLSFHALHAVVERQPEGDDPGDEDIYLGAHRIALSGDAGSVAVSELVVYSSTVPDPVYLNPLVPYYLMQHNERGDDNILWGLDYDWRVTPGLELYGEFVVDDLQYDRDTGHPDKYGVTIGSAWYTAVGDMDARLVAEYTNVRKWTYTHGVTEHRLEHDGMPVGFELGPDADRVALEARVHPSVAWTAALLYERSRKGEGTLSEPFEEDENDSPSFPSGVVETTDRVALELAYDHLDGIVFAGGAAYLSVSNAGNVEGEDDDDLELWAGVRFRIGRSDR